MKRLIVKILKTKFNALGTIWIAVLASLTTSFASDYYFARSTGNGVQFSPPAIEAHGPSILDCNIGVYSPVQQKCVPQNVFDAEMQRIFAALGIDTSIYQTQSPHQK